jgi:hypothetical protein
MTTLAIERRADLWRFALGSIGVAIFLFQTIVFADRWWIPGGDIRDIYIPAGEAVRAGVTPYVLVGNPIPFFYAPPIAVVFAALSFLPLPMVWALVVIAEFAALRYIARSWWLFGLLLAFPLMPFEIWGGTLNLIVAAAIVAAVRGDAWLVIAGSLMKIAPILARHSQSRCLGFGCGRPTSSTCWPPSRTRLEDRSSASRSQSGSSSGWRSSPRGSRGRGRSVRPSPCRRSTGAASSCSWLRWRCCLLRLGLAKLDGEGCCGHGDLQGADLTLVGRG